MKGLWNPIAPLIVWIIDKLKLINLEMHVRERRVDALRELARCPRLKKNRPLGRMLVHGALWHQYCSYIFLKVSSSLELPSDTTIRAETEVAGEFEIGPVWDSMLRVAQGRSKRR